MLDRDGVINVNREEHVRSWRDFEFLPGALEGIAALHRSGLRVAVVTNQSVINRRLATAASVEECHKHMCAVVAEHGGAIDGVFVCPHRPDEACSCRKPAPGLLLRAAKKLDFAIEDAILVGDHVTDLRAAERAGCASILTLTGRVEGVESLNLPSNCIGVMPDLLSVARHLDLQPGVL